MPAAHVETADSREEVARLVIDLAERERALGGASAEVGQSNGRVGAGRGGAREGARGRRGRSRAAPSGDRRSARSHAQSVTHRNHCSWRRRRSSPRRSPRSRKRRTGRARRRGATRRSPEDRQQTLAALRARGGNRDGGTWRSAREVGRGGDGASGTTDPAVCQAAHEVARAFAAWLLAHAPASRRLAPPGAVPAASPLRHLRCGGVSGGEPGRRRLGA